MSAMSVETEPHVEGAVLTLTYTSAATDLFTVDELVELIEQIHPKVVLPMHYFSQQNLARFLSLMRERYDVEVRASPVIELTRATLPPRPTIIALPGPH